MEILIDLALLLQESANEPLPKVVNHKSLLIGYLIHQRIADFQQVVD
jgi:hypothetical protein